MFRATVKNLLAHKLRLVLSGLAVVLGVMFVSGTMVLTDTIGRSFDQLISTAYEEVDVVVGGGDATGGGAAAEPIPTSMVDELLAMPEVTDGHGEIWTEGARAIDDRTDQVISSFSGQLGGNWPGDGDQSDLLLLREGGAPAHDHEIAINAELAAAGDFAVGDRVRVLTREPEQQFTVVGIFGYPGDRDSLYGETHIVFTTGVAQDLLLGERDVFTEVSLFAADDVSAEQLRDAVAAGPGAGYPVRTGEEAAEDQAGELREGLAFFNNILLGFAGVALFVGVFLILNTFSIIVAQRLRELALLRSLGASRRQVLGTVLLEAVVIGVLASSLGLLLGVGAGIGLASAVTGLLGGIPLAGVGVPAGATASAFAVGVLITVVAAIAPAFRAARVPPIAAMRESAIRDRPLTRLTVFGALVTAGGAAALAGSLAGDLGDASLGLLLGGVLLGFVGVSLLTPAVARPVASLLGRAFSWSIAGKLGRRNTGRNPRRTAITAAALMVGVALVTAASTVVSSLSASLDRDIGDRLRAELVIAADRGAGQPSFPVEILATTRELPDVERVAGVWYESVEIDGEAAFVAAVDDLPAWREMAGLTQTDGSLAHLNSGELLIDDDTARARDLAVGDRVTVALPLRGQQDLRVVGVYEAIPEGLPGHGYLMSSEDAGGFRAASPAEAFVELREGAEVAAVRAELERLTADDREVLVHDRSGYVAQQTEIYEQLLVFVQILLVLAMTIAVLGVINTLVLSVLERTRELGLLRAVGLGRGATMRMITVEAVVISLFGALLGLVVGAGLGATAVAALRDEGLSQLAMPWELMALYLGIAALVGVVAALAPALRAARLNVLAAIAHE